MNIHTLIATALLALILPLSANAQTPSLQDLLAQVAKLQAQLSAMQGAAPATQPQSMAPVRQCPNLTRALTRGAKGNDVTELQRFLIAEGHLASDSATGFFGPMTEKAVQAFQRAKGIASSGTPATTGYGAVGPATRRAIAAGCTTGGSNSSGELGPTEADSEYVPAGKGQLPQGQGAAVPPASTASDLQSALSAIDAILAVPDDADITPDEDAE